MKYLCIFLLNGYQKLISPLLGSNCRFYPTCSNYSKECLQKFSIWRALWYSTVRILKCHPYHTGGYDPIPHEKIYLGESNNGI